MPLYEDLIYYAWQFRLFDQQNLFTVDKQSVRILNPGVRNTDSGPDFQQAKILLDATEWVGTVEIHVRASDWYRHKHSEDRSYNNVILHVVYKADMPVLRQDGTFVPTLEIGSFLNSDLQNRYVALIGNTNWIPCEKHISSIENVTIQCWLSRMVVERLEMKSGQFQEVLKEFKGSWEDALYITLARNFGFKTNSLPFEMLARSLPQQILARHKNNKVQLESLIFGQAGFLNEKSEDQFYKVLAEEYRFLKNKYRLMSIDRYLWKFLRLRPQNFPTIRLAQFSALSFKSQNLFSEIIDAIDVKSIKTLFMDLPVSPYWETHYRFEKETASVSTQLGQSSFNNLLINSVVLTLFSYGKHTNDAKLTSKALSLLETIPFEQNHITARFLEMGILKGNADTSQAILHLKKTYCDSKKCLSCAVGIKIVNP